jgi:curved DNA-binding protein CbpA
MIASQHDEITFYEELGVEPTASPAEIHDAFRSLVRLLHPDQQTDRALKDIAEKQLRKINRIYAVLSDPERRQRYDETLREEDFPPTIIVNAVAGNPNVRALLQRFAWVGAALISAILLIWLASSQSNTTALPNRGRDQTPASYDASDRPASSGSTRDAGQSDEIQRLRSSLKAVTVERDAAVRELRKLRGENSPSIPADAAPADAPEAPAPAIALTELPSAPKPVPATPKPPSPASPALARIEPVVNRHLAGFWFYIRPTSGQQNKNQALYIPEYIEATITEENGMLRGKYRSRFVILDRAISPEVNFSFSGAVNGPTVTCPWIGVGGAKGEVTLTLMPNNTMRVDWAAREMGDQQGLSSGTAVLTRRIE